MPILYSTINKRAQNKASRRKTQGPIPMKLVVILIRII